MAIVLEKKQKINLTKKEPGLQNVFAGLGWDTEKVGNHVVDCDVSVFLLKENGKIPADEFLVFYNNLSTPEGSVVHQGDNRTGEGEGDDEVIDIALNRVSQEVVQMLFCVTIHEAEERKHTFGGINNAFIRICDKNGNKEICRYTLNEQFGDADSLVIGRLYRLGNEWEFEAMGNPFSGGLGALVELYT